MSGSNGVATPVVSFGSADPEAEGVRLLHANHLADAERLLRQAIRQNPRSAAATGNLGVALARQEKLPEAEAAFRLAARLDPTDPHWCSNLAAARLNRDDPVRAEEWAREAILLAPDVSEHHRLLGSALERQKDFEGAVPAFQESVRLDPRRVACHSALARILGKLGRHAEAEGGYRAALHLRPADAGLWAGLATALEQQGKAADAEPCVREAVKLAPRSPDMHNRLGIVLAAMDRIEDAEQAYRDAVKIQPDFAPAISNLGNALRTLGRLEEAERALRHAVHLKPKWPDAHSALGVCLVQAGRVDDAIKCYDEAIRLRPDFPEARSNRALAYLTLGDFVRGWDEYEWRWRLAQKVGPTDCPGPRWNGQPLNGKTILLLAEQGLGDTIQFARYATLVKARGADRVIIDAPAPLAAILMTCPGIDEVVPRGKAASGFHAHAPLLSLPGLLGTPPDVHPAAIPYLRPPADRVRHWQKELSGPDFKVGIAWQGSKGHKGDRDRSVTLSRFAGLALPGVKLYSLQKGPDTEQIAKVGFEVVDLGARTQAGMEDAAAAMMALDLIICVDTSLAHLAGATGIPVWVAVAFAADWRWLRHGETTRWYPSMRLFRQPNTGNWDHVFDRLAAELAGAVGARPR